MPQSLSIQKLPCSNAFSGFRWTASFALSADNPTAFAMVMYSCGLRSSIGSSGFLLSTNPSVATLRTACCFLARTAKEAETLQKERGALSDLRDIVDLEKRTSISRSQLELKHCSVFDSFVDGRFGVRKGKGIHERNLDDVDEFLEWKELRKGTEEQANSNPSWFWGRKDTKS